MTKLKSLSLLVEVKNSLHCLFSPPTHLLTRLSSWCSAKVFFAGSTGLPPDPNGRGRRVNLTQESRPPPRCCLDGCPPGDEEEWVDGAPSVLLLEWEERPRKRNTSPKGVIRDLEKGIWGPKLKLTYICCLRKAPTIDVSIKSPQWRSREWISPWQKTVKVRRVRN